MVIKTLLLLVVIVVAFGFVFFVTNTVKRVPAGPGSGPAGSDLLPVGTEAPEFALDDETGKTVRLSELRGQKNVVLIFYPGDDTPTCAGQLCQIRDQWPRFTADGVAVFGINPGTADSHSHFRRSLNLPFQLLVDLRGDAIRAYGARHPKLGITMRTVYGIDRAGRIVFAARGLPEPDEVLKNFVQS